MTNATEQELTKEQARHLLKQRKEEIKKNAQKIEAALKENQKTRRG